MVLERWGATWAGAEASVLLGAVAPELDTRLGPATPVEQFPVLRTRWPPPGSGRSRTLEQTAGPSWLATAAG
jgi:hypothetical protein